MFDAVFSLIMFSPVLIITGVIIFSLLVSSAFIVHQQEVAVIERLGKFHRLSYPGLHFRIPVIESIKQRIGLRTSTHGFRIDAKTNDNVTIGLEVSLQYRVSQNNARDITSTGVYRACYLLSDPIAQMQDYVTDGLRSSIPSYSLDDVFARKDDIARDVQETVTEKIEGYGFTIIACLITGIQLPQEVADSMNEINAAQRQRAAALDKAEADRIKRVTEAKAEAESAEETGRGIANQRKAIAQGIKDSLDTIKDSGVSSEEANELFMFSQWCGMMEKLGEGKANTIVLPSDFNTKLFQNLNN